MQVKTKGPFQHKFLPPRPTPSFLRPKPAAGHPQPFRGNLLPQPGLHLADTKGLASVFCQHALDPRPKAVMIRIPPGEQVQTFLRYLQKNRRESRHT